MEAEDSLASSRPGTSGGADDTEEGQYGSRPGTGKSVGAGGEVGTMAGTFYSSVCIYNICV